MFTSPVLKGTCGVLHVQEVYIHELRYENLEFSLKDGMVTDYGCTNFEEVSQNRAFVRETILNNYETLPIGEFAIGTNEKGRKNRINKKTDSGCCHERIWGKRISGRFPEPHM